MSNLLVVDDEPSICWGIRRLAEGLGHQVVTVSSAEEAMDAASTFQPHAVIMDVRLPGINGLTAMDRLRDRIGPVPVIMITAFGDLETAVQAIRRGAFEYIVKPFDLAQIEQVIQHATAATLPTEELSPLRTHTMLGHSLAMQQVFRQIALAAESNCGVLLSGESGTGKEMAAVAIHRYSHRHRGPFVPVNIAALNPTLVESELFGHVRGAFTGAEHQRQGLVSLAHGGTLFLDEVADIPLAAQVKLLRCLESGAVTPVGTTREEKVDFRIIAATHQDLAEHVRQGKFRQDLFFRLGAFRITLPSLRERQEDIPELAQQFLQEMAEQRGVPTPLVSEEAVRDLRQRSWQGNVRELRNAVEYALALSRGATIRAEHLPPPCLLEETTSCSDESVPDSTEELLRVAVQRWTRQQLVSDQSSERLHELFLEVAEQALFRVVWEHHGGQWATAARQLGIHRTTLRKKLDE